MQHTCGSFACAWSHDSSAHGAALGQQSSWHDSAQSLDGDGQIGSWYCYVHDYGIACWKPWFSASVSAYHLQSALPAHHPIDSSVTVKLLSQLESMSVGFNG